jgi:hypothetical protein
MDAVGDAILQFVDPESKFTGHTKVGKLIMINCEMLNLLTDS